MDRFLIFVKNSLFFKCILNICYILGNNLLSLNSAIGRFVIFTSNLIKASIRKNFFFKNFLHSVFTNGFCSIPVVGLTGLFTGAVLTLQLFVSLKMFGVENTIPYIVLLALMKELAPVLCALMIVSRVGSSMSAEIGSMATNNQIDVLTSMSINKYRYLYLPRILSMIIAQPILTTIAVITGVIGSFVVSTRMFGFTDIYFSNLIYEGFEFHAFIVSIVKGIIFGLIISLVACYKGNKTEDGAVGIKKTTISTVVVSCVYILVFNFIITWLMG